MLCTQYFKINFFIVFKPFSTFSIYRSIVGRTRKLNTLIYFLIETHLGKSLGTLRAWDNYGPRSCLDPVLGQFQAGPRTFSNKTKTIPIQANPSEAHIQFFRVGLILDQNPQCKVNLGPWYNNCTYRVCVFLVPPINNEIKEIFWLYQPGKREGK